MIKSIKILMEWIYNLILGFWTPFTFMLFTAFIIDSSKQSGEGIASIFLAIITIIVYTFLLIPNNIIFYKSKDNKIEKISILAIFLIGIISSIFFHNMKGIINIFGILIIVIINTFFLCFNKKSDKIYIFILLVLNLASIYFSMEYFNII